MFVKNLDSLTWGAGGSVSCKLDRLDPAKRTREIVLRGSLTCTKDVADTLAVGDAFKALSLVKIEGHYCLPGPEAHQFQLDVYGDDVSETAAVSAGGGAATVPFAVHIPFRRKRQPASDDGSISNELLHDKSIQLVFASATCFGGAAWTITSGTIEVEAVMVDETSEVPQLMEVNYIDPGTLNFQLPPGVYLNAFAVKNTGATISAAEVSRVDADVDGHPILSLVPHNSLVAIYNEDCARASGGKLTAGAATRVPLTYQDNSGKSNLTKSPAAEKALNVTLTGTLTPSLLRVVYTRAILKSEQAVAQIGALTGAPGDSTHYEPKTSTKTSMRSKEADTADATSKKTRVATRALAGKWRRPGTAYDARAGVAK